MNQSIFLLEVTYSLVVVVFMKRCGNEFSLSMTDLKLSEVLLYSIQRKAWVPHMNYKQRNTIYMYKRFIV